MNLRRLLFVAFLLSLCLGAAHAQQLEVPQVFRYTVTVPADLRVGSPSPHVVTARIYAGDQDGAPLWFEQFQAIPDEAGRVSLLLGSTNPIPPSLFAFNNARWLSLQFDDAAESPRAAIISVPYALKARDADTLGGLPPSAFLTSAFPLAASSGSDNHGRTTTTGSTTYTNVQPGALNLIPKFVSSVELGGSQLTDNGLGVGIGNTTPQEMLDVQGRAIVRSSARGPAGVWYGSNDSNGLFTGLRSSEWNAPFGFYVGGAWRINITREGRLGIGVDTPTVALEVNGGIKLGSGTLQFPDGTALSSAAVSGTVSLVPGDASITIANAGSATSVAVASQGIITSKIADAAVTTSKLADAGVTTAKYADGSITASKFAPGALAGAGTGVVTLGSNAFLGEQLVEVNTSLLPAISAVNDSSTNVSYGVYAETKSAEGVALKSYASSATGTAIAVNAISNASAGIGSYSQANSTTGYNIGAYGISRSTIGTGVKGEATSSAGTNYGVYGETAGANFSAGVYGLAANSTASSIHYGVYGKAEGIHGIGVLGYGSNVASGGGDPVGVLGWVDSTYGIAGEFVNNSTSGDIIVAKHAATNVWRVDTAGNQFMTGTVRTGGADFAELIEATETTHAYEPGDVLVISRTGDRHVELAAEAYSTRVLGIYATKPGVLASRGAAVDDNGRDIPVAMLGIVPAKASAENGPIQRGDLLVTSATPGYVMKATDRQRFTGAIVGKAMQPLEAGTGTIEIAVTLQ